MLALPILTKFPLALMPMRWGFLICSPFLCDCLILATSIPQGLPLISCPASTSPVASSLAKPCLLPAPYSLPDNPLPPTPLLLEDIPPRCPLYQQLGLATPFPTQPAAPRLSPPPSELCQASTSLFLCPQGPLIQLTHPSPSAFLKHSPPSWWCSRGFLLPMGQAQSLRR